MIEKKAMLFDEKTANHNVTATYISSHQLLIRQAGILSYLDI